MPLHWHGECELIRIREGELLLFLDSRPYRGRKGDIFFLPPGVLHRAPPQEGMYDCAVFDGAILGGRWSGRINSLLLPLMSRDAYPIRIESEKHPHICRKADRLFSLLEECRPYFELEVPGAILELFGLMYRDGIVSPHNKTAPTGHGKENMALLLEWIEENYAEKITLSHMASRINLNSHYLCRLFKEFAGTTPIEYLNRVRIDKACYEMSVGRKNATEAAYDTGFGDLSYFSRTFKKYKGISPSEYKKGLK